MDVIMRNSGWIRTSTTKLIYLKFKSILDLPRQHFV